MAGVVYDALRDELWAATRDGPATRDGAPIRRPSGDLAMAMLATGFG